MELELLRARSGRAVVERQLFEAQAMMEHYRSSWQQALEMSGHELVDKLHAEAKAAMSSGTTVGPSGACGGACSLGSTISPRGATASETQPSSGIGGGRSPSNFWAVAEAGTGGPPACGPSPSEEASGGRAVGLDAEADAEGHGPPESTRNRRLVSPRSVRGQRVPPLHLELVAEAPARVEPGSGGTRDVPGDLPSHRTVCLSSVDSSSAHQSPASTTRGCLSSRPAVSPRLIAEQRLGAHQGIAPSIPEMLRSAGLPACPSSSSSAPVPGQPFGFSGYPAAATAFSMTAAAQLSPCVSSRPVQPSGGAVQQPDDELMRVVSHWLSAAEQSCDARRHHLASTLRHLRSQLLDLRADAIAAAATSTGACSTWWPGGRLTPRVAGSIPCGQPTCAPSGGFMGQATPPQRAYTPAGGPSPSQTTPRKCNAPDGNELARSLAAAFQEGLTPNASSVAPGAGTAPLGWTGPAVPPSAGGANACAAALGMLLSEAFSGQPGDEWQAAAAAAAAAGTLAVRVADRKSVV